MHALPRRSRAAASPSRSGSSRCSAARRQSPGFPASTISLSSIRWCVDAGIALHRTAPHCSTVSRSGDYIVVTVNAARRISALHVASYARFHVTSYARPYVAFARVYHVALARSHVVLGPWPSLRLGDGRRRRKVSYRFSLSRHDCSQAATAGGTIERPATPAAFRTAQYRPYPGQTSPPSLLWACGAVTTARHQTSRPTMGSRQSPQCVQRCKIAGPPSVPS